MKDSRATAATRSEFYMIPNDDEPRKGFVITATENSFGGPNFEFCNGDRTTISLSELIVADADCDGFPTGTFSVSADGLKGADVYGNDLSYIGEIEELLLDENGSISSATISYGGFLGIDESEAMIEFKNLSIQRTEAGFYSVVLKDLSAQELNTLQKFDSPMILDPIK